MEGEIGENVYMCVYMCVCVCVRERVYVDRLYFKLAASHSRGNLNNAEVYGPMFLMCGCAMHSIL